MLNVPQYDVLIISLQDLRLGNLRDSHFSSCSADDFIFGCFFTGRSISLHYCLFISVSVLLLHTLGKPCHCFKMSFNTGLLHYTSDFFQIVFFSAPRSRHLESRKCPPVVAILLQPDDQPLPGPSFYRGEEPFDFFFVALYHYETRLSRRAKPSETKFLRQFRDLPLLLLRVNVVAPYVRPSHDRPSRVSCYAACGRADSPSQPALQTLGGRWDYRRRHSMPESVRCAGPKDAVTQGTLGFC
mmetsp:Transcript_1670/g.3886  ORF Transcript_1670/g.3886 Transcript_1670/m.3886 type:complete len:242 (-) Transcript_1670:103-828(-)